MRPVLVLRPEPGAGTTLARATDLGLAAIAAPIFAVAPVPWDAPDPARHDALMITSANAIRHGGPALQAYRHLPVYAVGRETAAVARTAGFADVRTGAGDVVALVRQMAQDHVVRPLHLSGAQIREPADLPFPVVRRIVYAADPVALLPEAARAALDDQAVALIHSPRASQVFARLLAAAGISPESVRIAAISQSAATGTWADVAIAETPEDAALLAAALTLCEKG
ncbi:uroporphyrinogen-III synthase [Sphingomonas sp. ASY06-1R]|jgi:uroporphyrinogen-III synthase|uniref:uroporphyrinogen-III synthase n=1 Tax=Sphingomonas sp. ASY06-1R TaxID=3445771 RepID=UPI003FA24922